MKENKVCIICDNIYYKRLGTKKYEWNISRFCSRQCSGVFKRGKPLTEEHKRKISINNAKNMLGKKHSEEAKEKNRLAHVGRRVWVETKIKMSKIAKEKGYGKWMKGRTQEKSTRWKGGMTRTHYGEDKIQRSMFRIEMQRKVFERDNYTCQLCGLRGVDLQVDHIQSWAEYVELRFCIDNCRTLCAKCHYHITYGKPMPPSIRAWGHNLFKGVKTL